MEWNYQIKTRLERSEKRKPTNTRAYWKQVEMKEKIRKNTQENLKVTRDETM